MLGSALPARAEAPLRVLVRAGSRDEQSLVQRLRGQTSDLSVRLSARSPVDACASPACGARAADGLGTAGVDGVLWFARVPDRLLVFLSRPGRSPVLLVRLRSAEGGLSSAELEVGAVVMRTALRALAEDAPVTGLTPAADERPTQPLPDAPASPSPDESASESASEGSDAGLSLLARVALQQWIDRSGPLGRQGLALRLGARLGRLRAGVDAGLSLPVRRDANGGQLRISRHDLLGFAGMSLDARARLWLELHAGAALYRRETLADDRGLSPSPAQVTPALVLGPGLSYRWTPGAGDAAWSLSLGAALDLLPAPPRFVFADGSTAHRVAPIAGRLQAGVLARWP